MVNIFGWLSGRLKQIGSENIKNVKVKKISKFQELQRILNFSISKNFKLSKHIQNWESFNWLYLTYNHNMNVNMACIKPKTCRVCLEFCKRIIQNPKGCLYNNNIWFLWLFSLTLFWWMVDHKKCTKMLVVLFWELDKAIFFCSAFILSFHLQISNFIAVCNFTLNWPMTTDRKEIE